MVNMTERKFIRAERGKYTLEEKEALGKLCKEYKDEYVLKIKETADKLNYNGKMKKHTKSSLREGYIARAVREFYPASKNVKHNNPNLESAIKLGKRCYENVASNENTCIIDAQAFKSKFRKPGGGRKATIPDVCEALFEWFIDVRSSLKARLPRKMFKTQCKVFYERWLSQ